MDSKLIYIAGPISADSDEAEIKNVNRGIDAFNKLVRMGHEPICPHLSYYAEKRSRIEDAVISYEQWLELDLKLITRCDAMLFLGPSPGANIEHAWAISHNIPIYYSIDQIKKTSTENQHIKRFLGGHLCHHQTAPVAIS